MGIANLIDEVKFSQAITLTAGASASTAINGTVLDMAGFDGVLVSVQFGAITAGAVTSIKMQQDSAVGMGAAADLAGTGQTIPDTADDTMFCIDLRRPLEQFVRLVVSRATQAAAVAATYQQYRARNKPALQPAGVTVEKWVSPAEGTP